MADNDVHKPKRDRSPAFPFIALRRAVERAQSLYENHRREPARLAAVASSWGYSAKSSGLLQTAAALKQFNLVEDMGSGDDRKIVLTKLGQTIVADQRPGARDNALKEAARSSAIIAEVPAEVVARPAERRPLCQRTPSRPRLYRGGSEGLPADIRRDGKLRQAGRRGFKTARNR
jgi:hypothetical protein